MDAAKPTKTLKLVRRSVLYNLNKITGDKPILTIYPVYKFYWLKKKILMYPLELIDVTQLSNKDVSSTPCR